MRELIERLDSETRNARIAKRVSMASKKSKVPEKDIEQMVSRMKHTPMLNPNRIAFEYLFPREKRFSFPDLDYGTVDPKLGIDEKKIEQYKVLKVQLDMIDSILNAKR